MPGGGRAALEFTPDQPGEHGFQGQTAMLRGRVIVE